MKRLLILCGAVLSFLPLAKAAEQSAQARLFCLSLRFSQGAGPSGLYTLDLSTLGWGLNGELAPYSDTSGRWVHRSWFELGNIFGFDSIFGNIYLQLPVPTDADGDGFEDFFEVSQGVNATTSGTYSSDVGDGTVQAKWNRPAGTASGSCVITLFTGGIVGGISSLGDFSHTFDLLDYSGLLAYSPAATTINGTMELTQTGNPSGQIHGPATFVKVASDPFNQLDLQPGGWTNELEQPLLFPLSWIDRDPRWPTNYYGYVEFDSDADTSTFEPYALWMLSIDDLNDADHDGIPDLSDDAVIVLPRRSQLTLTAGTTNLWLTVSGDVGHTNHVQIATDLGLPDWQSVVSFRLTNDPQTVSLTLPAVGPRFWRVLTE